jgi:hypothetical protein
MWKIFKSDQQGSIKPNITISVSNCNNVNVTMDYSRHRVPLSDFKGSVDECMRQVQSDLTETLTGIGATNSSQKGLVSVNTSIRFTPSDY